MNLPVTRSSQSTGLDAVDRSTVISFVDSHRYARNDKVVNIAFVLARPLLIFARMRSRSASLFLYLQTQLAALVCKPRQQSADWLQASLCFCFFFQQDRRPQTASSGVPPAP